MSKWLKMIILSVTTFFVTYVICATTKLISCPCGFYGVDSEFTGAKTCYVGMPSDMIWATSLSLGLLVTAIMFPRGYKYSKLVRIICFILFAILLRYVFLTLSSYCSTLEIS